MGKELRHPYKRQERKKKKPLKEMQGRGPWVA